MNRPRALYIMDEASLALCYGTAERREIADRVDLIGSPMTRHSAVAHPELLREVEVIFSGWGAPLVDETFLAAAPKLKAIFYAAGAVGSWMTSSVWDRGIIVSSAYAANAVPVAEYALAVILFSLKHGWALARQAREHRRFPSRDGAPGCYGSTVGLISLGTSARILRGLLQPFDLRVLAYDPYLADSQAASLGVEKVSLDELFCRSDVVSQHAPLLAETEGMIGGDHLSKMKPGATFINSARGRLVRHDELIEVAQRRQDLQFILDVTEPEPPPPDSPLYTLENVVLTPHIAGSVGRECERLGRYMVEELHRYLAGEPLKWVITPEIAAISSHRPMRGKVRVSLPTKRQEKPNRAAPVS